MPGSQGYADKLLSPGGEQRLGHRHDGLVHHANYAFNGGTALLSATSVTTEKADLSSPQTQITAYVYGTGTDDSSPLVYRDDLVCAVISGLTPSFNLTYLVSDIKNGSTSTLNVVEYEFDRQGETIQMTDQNGTRHDYGLDGLGRQVSDTVAVLGTNVDGGVMRIDTAYGLDGNVALTTSYSSTAGGTANIVNQVADTYNAFALLTDEQQSVSGAVTSSTPAVLYGYAVGTSTPTRLTSMTYPNGRVLTYGYMSGADSAVGRVSYLADSDGTVLAQYGYLGLDEIDDVSNPEPGITLDLGHKNGSGQLDRVDQFNRATDMVFAETGGNIQEILAGYDVSGNEFWQADPTAASNGVYLDKLLGYNALNELTSATQGTLNSAHTAITANQNQTETWTLDGMGNWSNYTQTVGSSTVIDQDRNTNSLNQVTGYNSTSTWVVPVYDDGSTTGDGNMTTMPQPGNETTALTCTYDAWNRLVEAEQGSTVLATYAYDGLNRRIAETAGGQTTAYYYDSSDQVLEERVSSSPLPLGEGQGEGTGEDFQTSAAILASLPANLQYVWGLRNVDDLVLRDSNNGSGGNLGISGSGLGLRLYALQDANWNVIALVSTSGAVQERFTYTAYGTATALNPNFTAYSGTNFHWTTLFAARDVDTATGLYYNNARWYNSSLGVFVTTDPAAADPNTYCYAADNPVTLTDPSGRQVARHYVWDPDKQDLVDTISGLTLTQVQAYEAAQLALQMASNPGRGWLVNYSDWFNRNVPGGESVSSGVGSAIYSAEKGVGMSDATIGSQSDTALLGETVLFSAAVVLGGEAVIGVGSAGGLLGGGLMGLFGGGTATGVAATGTALAGAAETPEGQELLSQSGEMLTQGSEYVVANAEKVNAVQQALLDFYQQFCPTPSIQYTNLPDCNGTINELILQRYMFSVSRYCKRTYSESGYQG